MYSMLNRFAAIAILISIVFSMAAYGDDVTENLDPASAEIQTNDLMDYKTYSADFSEADYAQKSAVAYFNESKDLLSNGHSVSAKLIIPQDGLYELKLSYISKSTKNIILKLAIDGKVPFAEAEQLIFPCHWVNENDEWKSKEGNQFTPEQIVYDECVSSFAYDCSGKFEDPFKFLLTAGEHEILLTVESGTFKLQDFSFVPPENVSNYVVPKDNLDFNVEPIIIEGEDAFLKNDKSLVPLADNGSTLVHPCAAGISKLNYIGGNNWKNPGQTIFWKFNVSKSGYYSIGFNYRQNYSIGGISYRCLRIDGKVPFKEASRIKFTYKPTWYYETYSNKNNEPYYIYLEKGEHTLSLTVTAGEISDIYAALQMVTAFMGNVYVDITKIVGETVDIYRSYELFNQIPNFNEKLNAIIIALRKITGEIKRIQGNKASVTVSAINETIRVVKKMLDNPYSAHKYKSQFYSSYTNLSALLSDMVKMPLDIDRIVLTGMNSDIKYNSSEVSLMDKILFTLKRFIITFSDDYNVISSTGEQEALTLWINWGRDQAYAFNSIVQDGFVKSYGIPVNIKLTNSSIVNAILAGKGPDCLIQMSRTEPVNLAMRGALVDLTQFDKPKQRLKLVSEAVERLNIGVEIEMADFAERSAEVVNEYFGEGARAGWINSFHTYYMSYGSRLICRLAETDNKVLRSAYDNTYRFIKGVYNPES